MQLDHTTSPSDTDVLNRFAVYATGTANLHDRANTRYGHDMLTSGSSVVLGNTARANTVYAGTGGVLLREYASIEGDILTDGIVDQRIYSAISEEVFRFETMDMPNLSQFSWTGPSAPSGSDIVVDAGTTRFLAPGLNYANITINGNGTLWLVTCGDYFMESLMINSGAKVVVYDAAACGTTRINIRNQLVHRGSIVPSPGGTLDATTLLLGIFGSLGTIDTPSMFIGTVFAPSGHVTLACNRTLVGAIYAEDITVFQDARVIGVAGGIDSWLAMGGH